METADTKAKVKAAINRTIRAEVVAKPAEANHTKTREVVTTSKSPIRDLEARCQCSNTGSKPCLIQE